jgi:hypothetical protein
MMNKRVTWEEEIQIYQNRWPFNDDYHPTKFQVDKEKKTAHYRFNKQITILFQFNKFYPKNPPKIQIIHLKGAVENFVQKLDQEIKTFKGDYVNKIMIYIKKHSKDFQKEIERAKKLEISFRYDDSGLITLDQELITLATYLKVYLPRYKMERVDKQIFHFRKSNKSVLIFEFPEDYPDSMESLKIEYWKNNLVELQTKKMNELTKKIRRNNLIYFALCYFERNNHLWEQETLNLQKLEKKEKNQNTIELAKSLGIPTKDIKMARRELEKMNNLNCDTKVIMQQTPMKITQQTEFEKEKEMVKQIPHASGTMFQLIKRISDATDLKFNLIRKTEIISNLKGLSSLIMVMENKIVASKEKVIIDVVKLVEIFSNVNIMFDAFIEEILIHSTFIVYELCNFSNCMHCLKELRLLSLFWRLSKRTKGVIKHHSNFILEKSGKNLSFSMNLLKLLNQPTFSDFKFICFDETIIYSHKFILNAFCCDFDLSLDSVYFSKEISSFAVFKFLEFIHSSCMFHETKENIKKMKSGGIDYLMKHLKYSEMFETFQNLENKYNQEKSIGKELDSLFEAKYLELLTSKDYSDISFLCKNSKSKEMETIPAHKAILACGSEYFEKMFTLGLLESLCDTIEGEFNSNITRLIFYYLYSESSNIHEDLNSENVMECLYASELYMIGSLKLHCEHMIVKMIDVENYDSLVRIADEFNCDILSSELNRFKFKQSK